MPGPCSKCLRWRGNECLYGVPEDKRSDCQIPQLDARRVRNAAMDRAAAWISEFPFIDEDQGELKDMIEGAVREASDPEVAVRAIRDRLFLSCVCPGCGEDVELEDGNEGDCPSCEGFLGGAEVSVNSR